MGNASLTHPTIPAETASKARFAVGPTAENTVEWIDIATGFGGLNLAGGVPGGRAYFVRGWMGR